MDNSTKTIMNHEDFKTPPEEYEGLEEESKYEDDDCLFFEVEYSHESVDVSAGLTRARSPIPEYCRYYEPKSDSGD